MFKKLLLTFLTLNVLFMSIFAPVAKAQSATWYHSDFSDWYLKVYDTDVSAADQIFGERYTAAQVEWIIYGVISYILGMVPFTSTEVWVCAIGASNVVDWIGCIGPFLKAIFQEAIDIADKFVYANPVESIATNDNNSVLAELFTGNRQLSTISELKRWGGNLHIIPEAKAQEGFGFSKLDIVREFWTFSRDATYSLIVIAAIAMAFMIMFRVKLSPQTVITVQSAIPKLIITLILITFSYAIAGFLVDLVYVVIGLAAAIISQADGVTWSDIYRSMTTGSGGLLGSMAIYALCFTVATSFALISPDSLFTIIKPLLGSILVFIVVAIAFIVLFFAAFKAFWTLIKALALFYITVIFAPFYILAGIVTPSMGFGAWLKAALSNLAVFPVVSILLNFSFKFLVASLEIALESWPDIGLFHNLLSSMGIDRTGVTESWVPPLLNSGLVPGNINATIFLFTSLAMIMLIPKAADIVKGFFSGRPYPLGTGIGEAMKAPVTATMAVGAGIKSVKEIAEAIPKRIPRDKPRNIEPIQ